MPSIQMTIPFDVRRRFLSLSTPEGSPCGGPAPAAACGDALARALAKAAVRERDPSHAAGSLLPPPPNSAEVSLALPGIFTISIIILHLYYDTPHSGLRDCL